MPSLLDGLLARQLPPLPSDLASATFSGATAGQIAAWDASAGHPVPRDTDFLNAKLPPFNAKGDAIELADAAVAAGTNVATSASNLWAATDVGKAIRIIQQAFTITGNTTAGSTSITSVSGWPSGLTAQNGMAISGSGIKAGSTIKTGAGTATITLPGTGSGMAATATATGVTLTVTGYVALSTTIIGFTSAGQVTLGATWGGSSDLTGCVAVYGTDDTTALTSLLTAASKSSRYFPNGNYFHTGLDVAAGFSSLNILGGHASRLILAPGSNTQALQFNATGNDINATTRGSRLTIRDLRIDQYGYAQRDPASSPSAVNAIGCDRVRFDNVEIDNARSSGFNIRGCNHVLVNGCRVDTVYFGGAGNSFNIAANTNYTAADMIVANCESFNTSDIGFSLGGAQSKRIVAHGNISVGGNSGVLCEGQGNADGTTHVNITSNVVKDCLNIGLGASGSSALREHFNTTITGNQATNCAIAIEHIGVNATISGNIVDGYTTNGVLLGGADFDEYGTVITGNVITAATTGSPGDAIKATKAGGGTNYLRSLTISGNRIDGGSTSTGGQRGIGLTGKLRNIAVIGNSIAGFRFSGIYSDTSAGSAPIDLRIIGNDSRNNDQATSGTAANQAGIAIEGATDTVLIQGNRCTDDQGSKTQQIGLHWLSATKGRIFDNDFSGNAATGVSAAFDQNTVARNNLGWPIQSVASASNVTVPPGEMVRVTGTTQIDTLSVLPAMTTQIIRFAASLTLKNSATLKLAGAVDFAATADDALTIVSDGTTMWEVARSVN